MKATARILTVIGMSIATGATLGVGVSPAQAAPAADQSATRSSVTTVATPRGRDDVVGYYDSRRQCEWAGERGEDRGWWRDYDCERVRGGRHHGDWALEVERRGRDHDDRDRDRDDRDRDDRDRDRH